MGNTAHKRTMKVDRRLQKSAYSQSHGGREDFLRPLNDPKLVFDGIPWDRVKHQLECPFHLQRLTEPTTLRTLYDISFLLSRVIPDVVHHHRLRIGQVCSGSTEGASDSDIQEQEEIRIEWPGIPGRKAVGGNGEEGC